MNEMLTTQDMFNRSWHIPNKLWLKQPVDEKKQKWEILMVNNNTPFVLIV